MKPECGMLRVSIRNAEELRGKFNGLVFVSLIHLFKVGTIHGKFSALC